MCEPQRLRYVICLRNLFGFFFHSPLPDHFLAAIREHCLYRNAFLKIRRVFVAVVGFGFRAISDTLRTKWFANFLAVRAFVTDARSI